jgi:hypothetical protein
MCPTKTIGGYIFQVGYRCRGLVPARYKSEEKYMVTETEGKYTMTEREVEDEVYAGGGGALSQPAL